MSEKGTADRGFEAFVRAHSAALLRLAYLLNGGDEQAAHDLTQTTLTRVFVRWSRVSTVEDPVAYTRRVMINANLSFVRRRRAREVPLEPAHEDQHAAASELSRVEDRTRLGPALRRLPPRQRAVIVLRFLEDMSERDTAEALGCSLGTVKSQTSRGLAMLRADPTTDDRAVSTVEVGDRP